MIENDNKRTNNVVRIKKIIKLKPLYKTRRGYMYVTDSFEALNTYPITRRQGKIQLVFTSPPFPLNRKKKYGNKEGDKYIEWIASFAPLLKKYIVANGSIVIEIGNGWEPGKPSMSTLPMEALLEFKKRGNFELCQEFICYNPARLPSPAQWVNIERCRVKDAFTRLWWMSSTSKPKADNKKILTGYSESMKRLLERGTYNAGIRPSEHNIGEKSFLNNNNGAIPPNILTSSIDEILPDYLNALPQLHGILSIANTASSDPFQNYCREHNLQVHPAKMPMKLAEFFIQFLTDEGDLVLDPFSGSNTTGFVAEQLKRRWISIECEKDYAIVSKQRFKVHKYRVTQ